MTTEKQTTHPDTKSQEYEKPEVRTEEVFETLALTCTKAVVGQCQLPEGFQGIRS